MTDAENRIGYCPLCGVVVSRHHADHPGEFHTIPPAEETR